MRRNLVLYFLILFITVGCAGKKTATSTCSGDNAFILNKNCEKVTWATLPVIMTFDDNVPENIRKDAISAAAEWETATGKSLFIFDTLDGRAPEYLNLITIIGDDNWVGGKEENAKTIYAYQNKAFFQSMIHIRERVLNMDSGNFKPYTILLHELGHVLGLAHDDGNRDSVMYFEITDSNGNLAPIDIARMLTLYP